MKKIMIMAIALLTIINICHADTLSERYEAAETLMIEGNLLEAAEAFDALLTYSDASKMAMYCRALYYAENNQYMIAISAFENLGDFHDSQQLVIYYTARQYQDNGTIDSITDANDEQLNTAKAFLTDASTLYAELALFKDCTSRFMACNSMITSIEEEQQRRSNSAIEAKYQSAISAAEKGDYSRASSLFRELNQYKDSAQRMAECYYAEGESKRNSGDWQGAVTAFTNAGSYSDAREQILATYYSEGKAKREAHDWVGAVTAFKNAKTYNDATTQVNATYYLEGETRRANKDWDGAITAFTKAGTYSDAKAQISETTYQKGIYLKSTGHSLEAFAVLASIVDYKDVSSLLVNDPTLSAIVSSYDSLVNELSFGLTKTQTKKILAKYVNSNKIEDEQIGKMDFLEVEGSFGFAKHCHIRLYFFGGKLFSFYFANSGITSNATGDLDFATLKELVTMKHGSPKYTKKTGASASLPIPYHDLYATELYRTKGNVADYAQWKITNKDKSMLFIEVVWRSADSKGGIQVWYTLFDRSSAAPYINR